MQTPIESIHDVRLVTLIGLAISVIESLALERDEDPDKLLADHLYLTNKYVHELGEEIFITKLTQQYKLLNEAIK